jgi:hypothetical protein
MGLDSLVRKAVAIADSVTTDLQSAVQHHAYTSKDGQGKPVYATAVTRAAVVDEGLRLLRTSTGDVVEVRATLLFLSAIAANGAAGRTEPIDKRDKFVLASGYTGPIVEVRGGVVSKSTGKPYMAEVWLG